METNSLINSLYNRMTKDAPRPVVGMGCTMTGWTDRYPGTVGFIRWLSSSKRWVCEIEVTADSYKVVKGSAHDGSAEYSYSTDPDGCRYVFVLDRKTSRWVEAIRNPATGKLNARKGKGLILGFRERYYDPSF